MDAESQAIIDAMKTRRPESPRIGSTAGREGVSAVAVGPVTVADAIVYLGDVIAAALELAASGGFDE